ncbi:alpha tubulin suppressor [Rhizina undulata]
MLCAFGSNGNCQLSLGHPEDVHRPKICSVPAAFPKSTPPKAIAAGGNHTLVLFPSGELFAAGDNSYGQCCIPTVEPTTSVGRFTKLPPPPDGGYWNLISASWECSFLVSSNNNVYISGQGLRGELGLGDSVTSSPLQKIPLFPPLDEKSEFGDPVTISTISSSLAHTIVVLSNGSVYGWGAGRKGQLGSPPALSVPAPRKLNCQFQVAQAVCGRELTFLISSTGDRHLLLGSDKFNVQSSAPPQGSLLGWKDVGASWGGVYVLMADGTIIAWGRNDKGQLPPAGLADVQNMAVGSEHCLAVIGGKKRTLVAWGWGEHGNCGKSREENGGNVMGYIFNVGLDIEGIIEGVGAGCATSWVWVQEDGNS